MSAGHLTDLIYTEKELVQSLREYIKAEESKLAAVKRCVQGHSLCVRHFTYHLIGVLLLKGYAWKL